MAEGRLHVVVRPWAEVHVDGHSIGTTPLGAITLPAGTHLVRLTHPEFRPLQRRIDIQPGETTSLRLDLALDGVPLRAP
jgi:serine/threonine-protein kinase